MNIAGKILGLSTVLLIPLSVLLILSTEKPPSNEIDRAGDAIAEARSVRADLYSNILFSEAVVKYEKAMNLWREENRKLIFLRNYREVKSLAEKSFLDALGAREDAIVASAKERKALKSRLENTKSLIGYFQETFSSLPVSRSLREENSKGRIYFAEAELAYKEGHFALCDDRLKESNNYLMSSYSGAKKILEDYFQSWPQWSAMVNETITETTRNGSRAILIDKIDRKCYLYEKGRIKEYFNIDLGVNWVGDKKERGDRATPEGIYRVTKMKSGGETRYYKALLLNYPNSEDKERFSLARMKGIITKQSEIGGMIEIHGKGGTGIDWTDGCIALTNSDMDILYSLCRQGTKVVIVGSTRPLDEILKYDR